MEKTTQSSAAEQIDKLVSELSQSKQEKVLYMIRGIVAVEELQKAGA